MIKGIIFDMDGVISDTQKLHSKVESDLLSRFGIKITPEGITEKYSGVKTKEFFEELLKKQNKEYDLDLLMKEKWIQMRNFLKIQRLDPIENSIDLIKKLYSKGYPLAVASASNLDYVLTVLKKLNVIDYFKFIIGGDMVKKGKPDPEIFLLAASKINVPAKNCLVIEDGRSGMLAAINGGMSCIGLVKDKSKNFPTKNLVLSLSEISLDYINKLKNN